MRSLPHPRQAGFTLIEILVIAPIVILAIGAFLTVIISMTGEVLASRGSNTLTYNIQDAMNRIEQDVKLSNTFLAETDISPLSTGQGSDNGTATFTNAQGTNGTALILKSVVTNANPLSQSARIVYLNNKPNDCASSLVQANTPMTMNIIYYVANDPNNSNVSTLWRRIIMPSNYTTSGERCSTPWQQPSCAVGYTAPFCKTNDIKLVSGVSSGSFTVQYFTSASATIPSTTASTASLAADRNTALSSTPTVGVSIIASQSVAGRTIERSASLRATRLETNATSVASVIRTTPSTPVVTGNLTNAENASFSWPASSGGGVVYDVDYNIDGGSWVSALSQSANLSYSRIALRGQTVNIRVRATNSAGTSSYGSTSVTIPLWNTPALQNNWAAYGSSYTTPGFTKTSAGVVILKGLMTRTGSVSSDETIAVLPPGFRPATKMNFLVSITGSDSATMYITADGEIKAGTDVSATATSLDRISFIPSSSTQYSWTDLSSSFRSGWSNRAASDDALFSYIVDSNGRTHLKGHLSPGTNNSGSTFADSLPTSLQVDPKLIIAFRSGCNGHVALNIGTTDFSSRGTCAGSLVALEMMYYPSTFSGWTGLTLKNGWVTFNASSNAIPEYTKSADGIVTLKGLIKSGTTSSGTVIATLPVGYRPKATIVLSSSCNDSACRFDVKSTGDIEIRGGSASWSSISGLNFMAEQ